MSHATIIGALIGYLLSTLLFLTALGGKREVLKLAALIVFRIGVALHTVALLSFVAFEGSASLSSSGDYYFWLSWWLSFLFVLGGRRVAFPTLGTFIAGSAALFLVSSSLLVHTDNSLTTPNNLLLLLAHVVPALIAETFLVFSCGLSAVFLVQERRLKKKSLDSLLLSGPSLDTLGKWNGLSLVSGFAAMSVAMISGVVWALSAHRPLLNHTDYVQCASYFSWVLLALILHGKSYSGWSARRTARITLLGVGLSISLFLAAAFLSGSILHGS